MHLVGTSDELYYDTTKEIMILLRKCYMRHPAFSFVENMEVLFDWLFGRH